MNRRRNKQSIKYSILIFMVLLITAGSAVGSYGELKIDTDSKSNAINYIEKAVNHDEETDSLEVFKESFKNNGRLLLIIGIGGLTIALFPAIFAVVLYKGISLGFTSALILEGKGKEGIMNSCQTLLLSNIIFIGVIIIYGYFSVSMALDVIKSRSGRNRSIIYADKLKLYALISAGAVLLLVAGAAIEAYVNPMITGLLKM